jgi:hypothetical protein
MGIGVGRQLPAPPAHPEDGFRFLGGVMISEVTTAAAMAAVSIVAMISLITANIASRISCR